LRGRRESARTAGDARYHLRSGILCTDRNRIVLPGKLRRRIFEELHDHTGHFGMERTRKLIMRRFWWDGITADINKWTSECETCAKIKHSRQKPAGLLQPLKIPQQPWSNISMDFITDLPKTKQGHVMMLVVVDRFSKMVRLIPVGEDSSAPTAAELFFSHVVREHGLPEDIVSDRDPRFTSKFWRKLFELLGT